MAIMKTKLSSFLIVLALLTSVHSIIAQGTSFTYQGRLSNNGGPASGNYDLTFKLFNASSSGSQVGSTITASGIIISNGLFTTTLDFGGVFNGSSYWLELGVRTNGAVSFTTLSPRQPLTPTPYAITAENVDGLVSASQLTGIVPTTTLSGANGSGLTSLNASQLTSGTVPDTRLSPNVALLNANQTFTGSNTFAGPGESITVNTGPISTTPFIGLGFQYFPSTGEGAILSSYNDGYGFLSFYTKQGLGYPLVEQVQIDKFGGVAMDLQNYNNGVLNDGTTNGVGLTFGTTSGEGIASQRTSGLDQYSLSFYTSFINRMIIMNNGFVGIGTTNPAAQLEVDNADTSTDSPGIRSLSGGGLAGEVESYGFYSAAGEFVGANGIIGVGTTNQVNSFGVVGITKGLGRAVYGDYTDTAGGFGYGVYGSSSSTNGTGVYAQGSGTGSALTIGSGAIHVSGASTNSTTTAAFTQVATAANVSGDTTFINNTLCNDDPNAILIITPNWNPHGSTGNFWTKVVGVWYNGSKWGIFNEDGSAMSAGPAFNVLIIKN